MTTKHTTHSQHAPAKTTQHNVHKPALEQGKETTEDKGGKHLTPQVPVDDKNTVDKGDHERMVRDQDKKDADRDRATSRPHRT